MIKECGIENVRAVGDMSMELDEARSAYTQLWRPEWMSKDMLRLKFSVLGLPSMPAGGVPGLPVSTGQSGFSILPPVGPCGPLPSLP